MANTVLKEIDTARTLHLEPLADERVLCIGARL
jgi:hypothetical protein